MLYGQTFLNINCLSLSLSLSLSLHKPTCITIVTLVTFNQLCKILNLEIIYWGQLMEGSKLDREPSHIVTWLYASSLNIQMAAMLSVVVVRK